jgi:hypothetical protein
MLWVGIGVCTFTLIPLQASQDQNILLKKLIVSTVPLWARGALTVLPQPQLQGASGTVISVRFEQAVSHMFALYQVLLPCTHYVFYVGIQIYDYFASAF